MVHNLTLRLKLKLKGHLIVKMKKVLITIFFVITLLIAGCSSAVDDNIKESNSMKLDSSNNKITVYKSPSCGCCNGHIEEYERLGFEVKVVEMVDLSPIKDKYNIPSYMQSCHTAVWGEYFIEGHVPSQAIEKLVNEKPDIKGISLPGMPSGTPGMPGPKMGDYVISQLDENWTEFMTI